jgi:hypothetical protein
MDAIAECGTIRGQQGGDPMTDDDVLEACLKHGPRRVFFAAYARMVGDDTALEAVGLPDVVDLDQVETIGCVAYRLIKANDRAADLADKTVRLARMD